MALLGGARACQCDEDRKCARVGLDASTQEVPDEVLPAFGKYARIADIRRKLQDLSRKAADAVLSSSSSTSSSASPSASTGASSSAKDNEASRGHTSLQSDVQLFVNLNRGSSNDSALQPLEDKWLFFKTQSESFVCQPDDDCDRGTDADPQRRTGHMTEKHEHEDENIEKQAGAATPGDADEQQQNTCDSSASLSSQAFRDCALAAKSLSSVIVGAPNLWVRQCFPPYKFLTQIQSSRSVSWTESVEYLREMCAKYPDGFFPRLVTVVETYRLLGDALHSRSDRRRISCRGGRGTTPDIDKLLKHFRPEDIAECCSRALPRLKAQLGLRNQMPTSELRRDERCRNRSEDTHGRNTSSSGTDAKQAGADKTGSSRASPPPRQDGEQHPTGSEPDPASRRASSSKDDEHQEQRKHLQFHRHRYDIGELVRACRHGPAAPLEEIFCGVTPSALTDVECVAFYILSRCWNDDDEGQHDEKQHDGSSTTWLPERRRRVYNEDGRVVGKRRGQMKEYLLPLNALCTGPLDFWRRVCAVIWRVELVAFLHRDELFARTLEDVVEADRLRCKSFASFFCRMLRTMGLDVALEDDSDSSLAGKNRNGKRAGRAGKRPVEVAADDAQQMQATSGSETTSSCSTQEASLSSATPRTKRGENPDEKPDTLSLVAGDGGGIPVPPEDKLLPLGQEGYFNVGDNKYWQQKDGVVWHGAPSKTNANMEDWVTVPGYAGPVEVVGEQPAGGSEAAASGSGEGEGAASGGEEFDEKDRARQPKDFLFSVLLRCMTPVVSEHFHAETAARLVRLQNGVLEVDCDSGVENAHAESASSTLAKHDGPHPHALKLMKDKRRKGDHKKRERGKQLPIGTPGHRVVDMWGPRHRDDISWRRRYLVGDDEAYTSKDQHAAEKKAERECGSISWGPYMVQITRMIKKSSASRHSFAAGCMKIGHHRELRMSTLHFPLLLIPKYRKIFGDLFGKLLNSNQLGYKQLCERLLAVPGGDGMCRQLIFGGHDQVTYSFSDTTRLVKRLFQRGSSTSPSMTSPTPLSHSAGCKVVPAVLTRLRTYFHMFPRSWTRDLDHNLQRLEEQLTHDGQKRSLLAGAGEVKTKQKAQDEKLLAMAIDWYYHNTNQPECPISLVPLHEMKCPVTLTGKDWYERESLETHFRQHEDEEQGWIRPVRDVATRLLLPAFVKKASLVERDDGAPFPDRLIRDFYAVVRPVAEITTSTSGEKWYPDEVNGLRDLLHTALPLHGAIPNQQMPVGNNTRRRYRYRHHYVVDQTADLIDPSAIHMMNEYPEDSCFLSLENLQERTTTSAEYEHQVAYERIATIAKSEEEARILVMFALAKAGEALHEVTASWGSGLKGRTGVGCETCGALVPFGDRYTEGGPPMLRKEEQEDSRFYSPECGHPACCARDSCSQKNLLISEARHFLHSPAMYIDFSAEPPASRTATATAESLPPEQTKAKKETLRDIKKQVYFLQKKRERLRKKKEKQQQNKMKKDAEFDVPVEVAVACDDGTTNTNANHPPSTGDAEKKNGPAEAGAGGG